MESYLVTELRTACTEGDLEHVKRLIELGASPLIHDDKGNTLFHLCCSSVQCGLEVLEYLISASGFVDCGSLFNNDGSTLLHLSCVTGKLEFVRFLFTQCQDCLELFRDIHGHTPLFYACKNQNSDIVLFICTQNIVLSPDDVYQCVKISTWEIIVPLLRKISFKNFMDRVIQENQVELAKLVAKDNIEWLDVKTAYPLHYSVTLGEINIADFFITKVGLGTETANEDGYRPLHIASASSHNAKLVKYLINNAECDINAKGPNAWTSLHIACRNNNFKAVKYITSSLKCNREAQDKDGNRPLHIACGYSGSVKLVKYLVDVAGCDINSKGTSSYTPLLVACEKDQVEIIEFLISKPECDKEAEDQLGDRALHIVCEFTGNRELVRHLVEVVGCDINANGQDNYTPLHIACRNNQFGIVKFLTSKPECNREIEDSNGNRPLHLAIKFSGNLELVSYLIDEAGCDINAKGFNGGTLIHGACEHNAFDVVKHLTMCYNCDVEAKDNDGNRPLHLACALINSIELVKHLVEVEKCDINASGVNGYTPLHFACHYDHLDVVKFLTSLTECDLEAVDNDGRRPLHVACTFSNNLDLVMYLVEVCGCDINAPGWHDFAPLQTAFNKKNLELVKYFTSHPDCHTVVSITGSMVDCKLKRLVYHHNKYQQAIKSNGLINLRVVKCILTGPPGAGKSTLKKRLLNETLVEPSFSTGIASVAVPVDSFRKIQKESAVVSGLDKNPSEWRKHSVDEEAAFIFQKISLTPYISEDANYSSLSICTNEQRLSAEKIRGNEHQNDIAEQRKLIHENDNPHQETMTSKQIKDSSNSPGIKTFCSKKIEIHNVSRFNEVIPPDDEIESDDGNKHEHVPNEYILKSLKHTPNEKAIQSLSEAVKSIPITKRIEFDKRSKQICESSHAILHVNDTGGQPEFHEILPALITGPAINLVVFKLTEDLKSRFMITYRSPTDDSLPYETSFTHEEVIFRSLASIACLRQNTIGWRFDELPIKDVSEPAAFLIATHRDCVNEHKVVEVNEQLKLKIQSSDDLFHDNLVQFSGKDQAIFALDTINDQEHIEHLRTTLHNVISKKFQELTIPVSWCNFNLKLHKSKKSFHKLDTCYKLAKNCGISDRDDFNSALWFLHNRVGSIMHYPDVKGLEDIVITDLQLVFDRITQLITSSFTYEFSGSAAIETEFRITGQFTESYLTTVPLRKGDPLTHLRLVTLLKSLHIVAGPFEANVAHKNEKYYFMPCALKPTTVELEHNDKLTFPTPLIIYFNCGYIPVGVFCCLVVHLLSSTSKSKMKWTLKESPHYRNKITFIVGKCYDQITLISHVTYLEVLVDRIPGVDGAIPLEELCPKIYSTLNKSLKIVTESLHYTYKSHHSFGFRCDCTTCQSSPPHPAICEYDDPIIAKCVDRRGGMPLLKCHKIWYKKVEFCSKLCFFMLLLYL